MSFDWLYQPLETVDHWLSGGFADAGWPVVLLLATLLGLRHATDPDHLAAVTALVTGDEALLALAIFAPMSAVSMAFCTALYGRLLTTPRIARAQATVGMPAMAVAGILFGGWYAGLV